MFSCEDCMCDIHVESPLRGSSRAQAVPTVAVRGAGRARTSAVSRCGARMLRRAKNDQEAAGRRVGIPYGLTEKHSGALAAGLARDGG
jgi:hypothetical protein